MWNERFAHTGSIICARERARWIACQAKEGSTTAPNDRENGAPLALRVDVTPRENSGNLGCSKAGNRGWVWRAATETSLSSIQSA